jgi:hypothetical protein
MQVPFFLAINAALVTGFSTILAESPVWIMEVFLKFPCVCADFADEAEAPALPA